MQLNYSFVNWLGWPIVPQMQNFLSKIQQLVTRVPCQLKQKLLSKQA